MPVVPPDALETFYEHVLRWNPKPFNVLDNEKQRLFFIDKMFAFTDFEIDFCWSEEKQKKLNIATEASNPTVLSRPVVGAIETLGYNVERKINAQNIPSTSGQQKNFRRGRCSC